MERTDDGSGDSRPVFVSGVTLGTYVLLGVFVAFAEWGVFPRETIVVGAPAIATALLLDAVLLDVLLVRIGDAVWLFVYAFLYVEALLFGFWMRWWRRRAKQRRVPGVE